MGACAQSKPSRASPAKKAVRHPRIRQRTHTASMSMTTPSFQPPAGLAVRKPPQEAVDLLQDVLSRQDLFQEPFSSLVTQVVKISQLYRAPSSTVVFAEGCMAEYIYCVYSGKLALLPPENKTLCSGSLYGLADLYWASTYRSSAKSSGELLYWAIPKPQCLNLLKSTSLKRHNRLRAFLENTPMFKFLAADQLDTVIDYVKEVCYEARTTVITEGQVENTLYFILKGTVTCYKHERLVRTLSKGNFFGEKSVLFNVPRTANAVAEPNTVLLVFSKDELQRVFGENLVTWLYWSRLQTALYNSETLKYLLPEKLQSIAEAMEVIQYRAQDMIITRQTKTDKGIWIVLNGRLTRLKDKEELEETALIGEAELLCKESHTFPTSFRALSDCEIGFLSRNALEQIAGSPLSEGLAKYRLVAALKQARPIHILKYTELERIADRAVVHKFKRREVIFEAGQRGEELWVVCEGQVNIVREDEVLRTITGQGSFGYRAVVSGEIRSAGAVAATDVTCWAIHKQFLGALFEGPVMKYVQRRLRYHDDFIQLADLRMIEALPSRGLESLMVVADTRKQQSYVLKTINRKYIGTASVSKTVNAEREIMQEIDHPMAASLVKAWKDEERVYFLMEHVQGTELFELLQQAGEVSEETARFFTACLVLVLEHLHNKSIVFRDLKPENILVDHKGYPKLWNFHTAKILRGRTATILGTPQFMAPEVIQGKTYGLEADLWSLGVLLYEMQVGCLPFGNELTDPFQICKTILEDQLHVPKTLSSPVRRLIRQLLSIQPCERGSSAQLKTHPWLENVDWSALVMKSIPGPYSVPKPISKNKVQAACASKTTVMSAIKKLEDETLTIPQLKREGSSIVNWDSIF